MCNRVILFVLAIAVQYPVLGQTVKGLILDDVTKQPLPGVTVVMLETDTLIGTVTDASGYFRIDRVSPGRHSFQFTFVGYEPLVLNNVLVHTGKETVLNLTMTETVEQLDEIVVSVSRSDDQRITNNDMVSVSGRPFSMDETKRYAGSLGDPARMVANYAGVVATNDVRNDIIIRGNGSSSMLWTLNGLNIPNPNHFGSVASMGGAVSMLNSNNLDKSDFLTGAFPAQYGNALSGVFDLTLRKGNNEKREYVAQTGLNGFEFGIEGPFRKERAASYLLNARYSTLAAFQELGLSFGTGSSTPSYFDINYHLSAPMGKKSEVSLYGIWGRSSIDLLGSDYDTTSAQTYGSPNSNDYPRYYTNISGLTFNHRLSEKTFVMASLGYSRTDENYHQDSISAWTPTIVTRSAESAFVTNRYSILARVSHKFNAKHSLTAGITEDIIDYSLFWKRIYGGEREELRMDQEGQHYLTQGYVQWRYRLSGRFTLTPGLHFQSLNPASSHSIEPRMGLTYQASDNHVLALGYGLHSQMQNVTTYAVVTPSENGFTYTNKDLGFTKSEHYVLSHDWHLTDDLHIKTELYYQDLFDIPVTRHPSSYAAININAGFEFIPSYEDSLVNGGTGRNYGIELTLEKFFGKGYYYLVTASLFDSKYRGSDGILRNTSYNMGRVINLLAGKEFSLGKDRVLGISIRTTWTGGRYITPIDHDASVQAGRAIYQEDKAFSERQTDYFRTDLKFTYRKEFTRSTLELALDLQNITNKENIFSQGWDNHKNEVIIAYQQGFFPIPFVRWIF
ncbi:MAG TPA: TonB-dependent receptor [Cyclobacteriaceae bacterium]|jgi:hypothetical protein